MYRTCLIQLATDIPTSKLSNYNTGGRKSRLRLAFCPGSLPAIPRVNAANSRGLCIRQLHATQRCEIIARNNARSSSIFDVRIIEPDGKEPPDRKIPHPPLPLPLPGSMSATLRTSIFRPFSSRERGVCIIMPRVKGDRH